ncbi:MAG: hypothetical protein V4858_14820 [Pseudomonadota bacterium]
MSLFTASELCNAALEFHDSNVAVVKSVDGGIQISFAAAYVHRSNGSPGVDAGSGYIQAVECVLREATWNGALEECIGRLLDGKLKVDGRSINLVPLPFQGEGHVTFHLEFSNGAVLSVSGASVHVYQSGPAQFVEKYAC